MALSRSWFDLKKYNAVVTMTPLEWVNQIRMRSILAAALAPISFGYIKEREDGKELLDEQKNLVDGDELLEAQRIWARIKKSPIALDIGFLEKIGLQALDNVSGVRHVS